MNVKQLAEKHGFAVAHTLPNLFDASSDKQIKFIAFNYSKFGDKEKKILDQAGFKTRLRQQLTSKFLDQFRGTDFIVIQPNDDTFIFIDDEQKLTSSPDWKRALTRLYNSSDVFQELVEKTTI